MISPGTIVMMTPVLLQCGPEHTRQMTQEHLRIYQPYTVVALRIDEEIGGHLFNLEQHPGLWFHQAFFCLLGHTQKPERLPMLPPSYPGIDYPLPADEDVTTCGILLCQHKHTPDGCFECPQEKGRHAFVTKVTGDYEPVLSCLERLCYENKVHYDNAHAMQRLASAHIPWSDPVTQAPLCAKDWITGIMRVMAIMKGAV